MRSFEELESVCRTVATRRRSGNDHAGAELDAAWFFLRERYDEELSENHRIVLRSLRHLGEKDARRLTGRLVEATSDPATSAFWAHLGERLRVVRLVEAA